MISEYFYAYNIIFDITTSANAKLVYTYLCKCADKDGKCFPSHGDIGVKTGLSVTSVKKSLTELENAGFIAARGEARPDSGRRANTYTVNKDFGDNGGENCTNKGGGFFLAYGSAFMAGLTAKARVVYLYLCRLASGSNEAYPSHNTTAAACGLSKVSVRLALDELEAAGLIKRQAQFRENGGQRANLYTIITEDNKDEEVEETEDGEAKPASNSAISQPCEFENLAGQHTERGGKPIKRRAAAVLSKKHPP